MKTLPAVHTIDVSWQEEAVLRDGTRVLVRVVGPADRELLRQGFRELSPRTRWLRFLAAKDELSDAELDELLRFDGGEDKLAVGARRIRPDGTQGEGLGIARFARKPGTATAEVAVVVVDAEQGKGLGTLLLLRLARAARERGIERISCEFDAGNEVVWRMVQRVAPGAERLDHGFARAEVPLPPLPAPRARRGTVTAGTPGAPARPPRGRRKG